MSARPKSSYNHCAIIFGEPLLSAYLGRALSGVVKASSEVSQVETLSVAQAQNPAGESFAVIGAPAAALGAMLQAGHSPQAALKAWTDAARRLSTDLDTAKKKIRLLVISHDKADAVTIRGAQAARNVIEPLISGLPDDNTAPWMILAAFSLIKADKGARALADSLMQHVGLDELSDLPTIENTITALQDLFGKTPQANLTDPRQRMLQAEARLTLSVDTIDRLHSTITQQLDEVTRYMQSKAALQTELNQLRTQLTDQYLIKSQVDAIQRQIGDVQETQRLREAVLGAQILRDGEILHDAEVLRATLDKVYNSTSWKTTAPLRSLRRKVSSDTTG